VFLANASKEFVDKEEVPFGALLVCTKKYHRATDCTPIIQH